MRKGRARTEGRETWGLQLDGVVHHGGEAQLQGTLATGEKAWRKVLDTYFHQGLNGNQIAGRLLSLLPSTDARFAVLPAHFPPAAARPEKNEWVGQIKKTN